MESPLSISSPPSKKKRIIIGRVESNGLIDVVQRFIEVLAFMMAGCPAEKALAFFGSSRIAMLKSASAWARLPVER